MYTKVQGDSKSMVLNCHAYFSECTFIMKKNDLRSKTTELLSLEIKLRENEERFQNLFEQMKSVVAKSEHKYRSFFDNAIEGIFQTTPEGQYLSVNPALARMIGYDSPEEMIKNITNMKEQIYVNPEDRVVFKKALEEQDAIQGYEIRHYRKDGSTILVSINARAERDKTGRVVYYEGTIEDITSRRQAEEQLILERQRFSILSEKLPFGMVMIDKDGNFIYINPKFKEMFGYDLSDTPDGKTWFRKAYPDFQKRHKAIKAWKEDFQNFEPGEKSPHIFTVVCKDSSEKIVNIVSTQLETGEYLVTYEDITLQKKLEEQLHAMSFMDELTGLYNRRGFFTLAQQQLKVADRAKKDMFLFFADLDKMKQINDTFGHKEGDKALVEISTVLKKAFRKSDIIGRMGGDEFAVLAIDSADKTGEALRHRLYDALEDYNSIKDNNYVLSLSIGTAHYDPECHLSLDKLMAQADEQMYAEKRKKQQ
jgi:diguanylate cyclase (GGDEF)-like protein/PAS domain S-box-containing protein